MHVQQPNAPMRCGPGRKSERRTSVVRPRPQERERQKPTDAPMWCGPGRKSESGKTDTFHGSCMAKQSRPTARAACPQAGPSTDHDGYDLEQNAFVRTKDRPQAHCSPGGSCEASRSVCEHVGGQSVRLWPQVSVWHQVQKIGATAALTACRTSSSAPTSCTGLNAALAAAAKAADQPPIRAAVQSVRLRP